MIDRIRADIEQRLEQLLAEADKLREALSVLGSSDGNGEPPTRRRGRPPRAASSGRRGRAAAGSLAHGGSTAGGSAGGRGAGGRGGRARSAAGRGARATGSAAGAGRSGRTRTASGATRSAVLEALAKAGGQPLTAGQVASATGLGRPSVSTTLSKLARSGEVTKAQRGYSLGSSAGADRGSS
jgi:DNA-binding transcriptional ArsR family regulator